MQVVKLKFSMALKPYEYQLINSENATQFNFFSPMF